MATLIHRLYCLAVWLAQPLLRRKLRRRGAAEPLYMHAVPERFGHYAQPAQGSSGLVWIHAVSLGETRAAAILLAELRQRLPDMRLLLTSGTATGRAEGGRLLRPGDIQVWQPWDTAGAVRRFVQHFRPAIGVLMDTEVWPNLVQVPRACGVPMALVNARLNEKSLRNSLRLAAFARQTYAQLSTVLAQTQADAQRLRQLHAPVQAVTGNIKFDAAPDAAQMQTAQRWRSALQAPVIMLASSRQGEEAQWLAALQELRQQAAVPAAVQWLVVPRHPQRFGEVAALAQQAGWRVSQRSGWADAPPALDAATLWLGDSMGEMALYYSLADVALLGGSFEPLGGQNLIEAAACGCPVIMGAHTFNFAEAAEQAISAGAAWRADDMAAAVQKALTLPGQPQELQRAAESARAFAAQHRGAAARTADALVQLLGEETIATQGGAI